MKQKLTITIADVQMNIVTEESPEAVENLRSIVDRRILEIYLQSGNRCPKTEAALLCALDYCAEKNKMQEIVSKLEEELKTIDIESARQENKALTEELNTLREQLAESEEKYKGANADVGIAGEQLRILTQKTVETEALVEALKNKLAEAEAEIARLSALSEKINEQELEEQTVLAEQNLTESVAEQELSDETESPVNEVLLEQAPIEEAAKETRVAEKEPVAELAEASLETFEIEMKPLRKPVDENQLTIDSVPEEKKVQEKIEENNLLDTKTLEKEKQKAQKRVRSMFDLITFDNV